MSAADRNHELAADLARRAIAAERRAAEEAADLAERLRGAADQDGRLSVDDAIGALTDSGSNDAPLNPFAEHLNRTDAKQSWAHERLFGRPSEPADPATRPEGDADAGKGNVPAAQIEHVQTDEGVRRMEVFDLNNLDNDKED